MTAPESKPAIDPGAEPNRNPAKTSVDEIVARAEKYEGHGLQPNEVLKLAQDYTLLRAEREELGRMIETLRPDAMRYQALRAHIEESGTQWNAVILVEDRLAPGETGDEPTLTTTRIDDALMLDATCDRLISKLEATV